MKWRPLMAVLIGLLMVGVTAGSAMATPTTETPVKPMLFGDKSELHLSVEPHLSYVYRGKIYLAYHWEWDHTEKLLDASSDYIIITIPWQIYLDTNGRLKADINTKWELQSDESNKRGYWDDLFYMEKPEVVIYPSDGSSVDAIGLITWEPKKIDGYWFRFMKIRIKVDDDISSGYVYVIVRPKPEYQDMKVTTSMYYIHTYSRGGVIDAVTGVAVSLFFPEKLATRLIGTMGSKILSGIISWAISDFIDVEIKGWEKSDTGDVTLSYDAYLEVTDPPNPRCFKGICPTFYGIRE